MDNIADNKDDLAIENFTKVIKLNPDYEIANYWRADAYAEQGDFERAIEDSTKTLELNPD
jgi:tetratricopeptide (TPR) repeat protein